MDISHENMEIRLLCRRRFVNDADSGNTFVVDDADHREGEMLHFAQILALIVKPDGYFVLPARFFHQFQQRLAHPPLPVRNENT